MEVTFAIPFSSNSERSELRRRQSDLKVRRRWLPGTMALYSSRRRSHMAPWRRTELVQMATLKPAKLDKVVSQLASAPGPVQRLPQ